MPGRSGRNLTVPLGSIEASTMERATLATVQLEYETHGSGEAVILIHGSVVADSYVPMMSQPSLGRYQLVRYRRRGFGGSTHPTSPVSIGEQAADLSRTDELPGDFARTRRRTFLRRAHRAAASP
jgi:pimeloyl-ACP methyl ester carboxylesterase